MTQPIALLAALTQTWVTLGHGLRASMPEVWYLVMDALRQGPLTASELTSLLGVSHQQIYLTMKRLEKRHWVEADLSGSRVRYGLSPSGLAALSAHEALLTSRLKPTFDRLDEGERHALVVGLTKLHAFGCRCGKPAKINGVCPTCWEKE